MRWAHLIRPQGHVLDVACGSGRHSHWLAQKGFHVTGVDRDPLALQMAAALAGEYGDRLSLVAGNFSGLDTYAGMLDGIVLDLGVSSMQLDQAERGFSFQKDGPLDMRMSQEGRSAADLVNETDEAVLADILYLYGEERASRRIARAIVEARKAGPIATTLQLAEIVASCLPRPKFGQSHPATRSFQAIRIAVNAEFDELAQGLAAAERALKPGGKLAVVTFHSLEDRIVKRFFQTRTTESQGNRYAPTQAGPAPSFTLLTRRAVGPDDVELAENPRSRSAKLRVGLRTTAPAHKLDFAAIDVPLLRQKGGRR